jgi:predicted phage baseplate assembly protein
MPIPMPDIDDRTWADLVEELRSQLPHSAPGWTDHNLSDPGITLLELFAWVSELLLYRMDRVAPATRRAFLRQLGVEPAPPRPARTVVALRLPPRTAPYRLAAGRLVTDSTGQVRFSTTQPVDLSPAWLEQGGDEPTLRGRLIARGSGRVADVTGSNRAPDGAFHPFGAAPRDGDSLELGFDVPPVPLGSAARLQVWTERWREDGPTLGDLRAAFRDWTRHPGIRTIWQYWTGAPGWRPVARVDDETRGLTLSGPVTLAGLEGHRPGPGDGRYRVRCLLASGAREHRPRLRRIAINAVPVEQTVAVAGGRLAVSRGEPGQTYELGPFSGSGPVLAGSLRLEVGGTGPWREVPDWDRSGPFDQHVRLDPERGMIEFGDGRSGLVPPAGSVITVTGFRAGGGPEGNVPAGTLHRLAGAAAGQAEVVQPEDALGGTPAEPLSSAQGRLLERLATPHRGVTGPDLEALALGIPGLAVRRARAVPGRHPGYPGLTVPGAVTIVVLTANGTASATVVHAVQAYLDPRRPVGCELHVAGPGWRPVQVGATLHAARGAAAGIATRAAAALDAFFDPVTGGPEGTGWPFGRDVYRAEVAAVLADVPGLDRISDLTLFEGDGAGGAASAATCPNLPLCPTDLVRSLPHSLHVLEA